MKKMLKVKKNNVYNYKYKDIKRESLLVIFLKRGRVFVLRIFVR